MSDLLFAVPWWLFLSLFAVGVVVFWSGNNRRQKGVMSAGVAVIVLALLWKGIGFLVETDKEICTRQTNELVKSVQDRDWSKFDSLLDEDVSLGTTQITLWANAKALSEGTKSDCERYGLQNIASHITDVQQDATGVTVDMSASGEMKDLPYRVPTNWKLLWDRTGKQWRLHSITCLQIGADKPEQMAQHIK